MKTPMILTALSLVLASSQAFASELVQTRVFRLVAPTSAAAPYEALATDGRVYFVSPADTALASKLEALVSSATPLSLTVTGADSDLITDARALSGAEAATYTDDFANPAVVAEATGALDGDSSEPLLREHADDNSVTAPIDPTATQSFKAARVLGYEPTVLASMADAQRAFRTERSLKVKSQCYERAHVWSREMEAQLGIKSMKVFMFFTDRFRYRFKTDVLFWTKPYKWWFHVAPFVYVAGANGGKMQEVVLDRAFLDGAVSMDDWTFEFIGKVNHDTKHRNPTRGEAACQDATSYSQFSSTSLKNPHPRYCVLRKVPMYIFQPLDIEALDEKGVKVPGWRPSELKWAFNDTAK